MIAWEWLKIFHVDNPGGGGGGHSLHILIGMCVAAKSKMGGGIWNKLERENGGIRN